MVSGLAFVGFGLLAGFTYLANVRRHYNISYGLGLLAIAFFLSGASDFISPTGTDGRFFLGFFTVVRNVAVGGGLAFLGYVAGLEAWRRYRRKKAPLEVDADVDAVRVPARQDPAPAPREISVPEPTYPSYPRRL